MSRLSNISGYGTFSNMSKEEFLSFLDGYNVSYKVGGKGKCTICEEEIVDNFFSMMPLSLPLFEEVVMKPPASLKMDLSNKTTYQATSALPFAA